MLASRTALGIAIGSLGILTCAGVVIRFGGDIYKRPRVPPTSAQPRTRVLVLGGGFGGLYTALDLEKEFALDPSIKITLVDRNNFHLFTPMLPLVSGGLVEPRNVIYPIRRLLRHHRLDYVEAEIESIDLSRRKVYTSAGEMEYDYVVVALGAVTNYFGAADIETFAYPFKCLADAISLKNHVIEMFEKAALEPDPVLRRELLTFAVGGGGPTGVEVVAGLHDFIHHSLIEEYPNVDFREVRIVLLEATGKVLANFDPDLARAAVITLKHKKIDVMTNAPVGEVTPDSVKLRTGERIPTRTLVWAAGVKPNPVVAALPMAAGKNGALPVDEFFLVKGAARAFALGDNASAPDPRTGTPLPPDAKVAIVQAKWLARNVIHSVREEPLEPFQYEPIGDMVTLGTNNAVAEIKGMKLRGLPAWMLWRTYYLSRLMGRGHKVKVATDFLVGFFFERDTAKLEAA